LGSENDRRGEGGFEQKEAKVRKGFRIENPGDVFCDFFPSGLGCRFFQLSAKSTNSIEQKERRGFEQKGAKVTKVSGLASGRRFS
jgi:hypothetical protein